MKMLTKFRWGMGIVTMLASLYAQAYPGENIVLDPVTGNYTITYWDEEEPAGLEKTTFVPATKIIPAIRCKFRLVGANDVAYSYTVANGAAAKQAIVGLSLEQTARVKGERDFPAITATADEVEQAIFANMSTLDSPENWSGNIYSVLGYSRIVWRPDELETGGVKAGRTQVGFGFSSPALPGVSEARMKGIGQIFGYAGDGPAMDSTIRPELERLRKNNFIARPAAVPTIAVPAPFDAAVLLDRIRAHVATWPGKHLLDPAFSTQLDRYMVAAADAYRRNQPKAGKEHIQTLRKMLKKEHEDADRDDDKEEEKHEGKSYNKARRPPIDHLAARILDFDLKYVMKRVGGDKDD